MSETRVRALQAEDAGSARALVAERFGGTRYGARLLEQLDITIGAADEEYRGLAATSADDDAVRGVVMFGPVAGARGAVKLHALVGANVAALKSLVQSVLGWCAQERARLAVCECADDACFANGSAALGECGFVAEGFIPDLYSDGIGLFVLVWRAPS